MKLVKKLTSVLAFVLILSMVLSGCQVPEGVEVPSGVSIPSDLSDLTSEELAQLESYLEEEDISLDADAAEDAVSDDDAQAGDAQAGNAAGVASAESDAATEGAAGVEADTTTGAGKDIVVKSTVDLPSGRDWVHKILNVEEYVKAYPDLQAAYGENWDGYVDHYLTYGLYEGRDEGKLFDPWVYAEAYPDVKAVYGDDANAIIQHYVNHGYYEGKTAGTAAGYVDMADKVSREYMMSHEVYEIPPSTRMEALIGHAETALKYARNIEGANQPKLFADGLNVDTYEPVMWNKGLVENEPVCSNFYSQLNFIKMLDGLTLMTGEEKYSEAALEQISLRFDDPALSDANGLIYAGGHKFIDIMSGESFGLEYHETKDYQLPWELIWKVNPEGTLKLITAMWNAHILDWSNLAMNRHGIYDAPMTDAWDSEFTDTDPWMEAKSAAAFMSTGNDLMEMAFFLTEATGDPKYAVWGERMLDKYIAIGNQETGLVGEQYGIMSEENTYGVDRLLYSVIGADFVTRTGFDFKTATMDDYKKFGANSLINRVSLKSNTAYGPLFWTEIYCNTGNEKVYNFVKNSMVSWEKYVYDKEKHRYNTPIFNDGTDLNEGKDGKQLIATKTGYYLTEGKAFPEYESIWAGVFPALIATVDMLKPDDTEAYDILWNVARVYARNIGLGDIGTRMGENINMTPAISQTAAQYVQAVVMMYKYTGAQEYLDAACVMADRIVADYYNPERKLFTTIKKSPYAAIDTEPMYAVFMVEAAARGFVNEIDLGICHGSHDIPHEGRGQVSSAEVWWDKTKVAVKDVNFDRDSYSIIVDEGFDLTHSDLSNAEEVSGIRQMTSIGVMGGEADGFFHPEKPVTRGELVGMVNRLFGFTEASETEYVFAEVDIDEAYAHYEVNRAELSSVIVRALKCKFPDKTWHVADALYRITDAASIPAWAKDYADIVTNYRLMVDLEDDTFEADKVVTKDMIAGIFQEVARYLELPSVKAILPEIRPFNADSAKMTWETLDGSVVEVDSQGRLYPVSVGTTMIRVTADDKYADLLVTVTTQDEWMVKEVFIDGELYDAFNADVLKYSVNLDKGTHAVPTITANSFSGAEVIVNPPTELPGTVEFYVSGSDIKYTLHIDNTYIDYIVDENFNHNIGKRIENIITDRFTWFVNGITIAYRDRWRVVPKNWVKPHYEGYGCMVFPYEHQKNLDGQIYLTLSEDDIQLMGENADDMLMVFEMDLAVKNIEGKKNGYDLWFMEKFGVTYHAAAHFRIDNNGLQREVTSTTVHKPTKREMVDGEFVNFRIVIDKKNRTFDYFYNGDLLQKDIEFFHGDRVPNIYAMYIGTPMEDEACNAELYMDNLKVYQITHAAYEEMMPQEELPPPTPKPEWLTNPIDIDFDKFKVGTTIQQTAEDPYTGHVAEGQYNTFATVVAKNTVDPQANASDKCMEIKYKPNLTYDGNFRYLLDDAVVQKLGDEADDNNLVLEMDVAVGGEDNKPAGYAIAIGQPLSTGYHVVARMGLIDNQIGRIMNSQNVMVDPTLRTTTTKGKFNHIKIVINKKTKNFSYYIDGIMVEQNVEELHPQANDIGTIWFSVKKEAEGEIDSKLYVDNLKLYVEAPGAEPTPRPTHVPVPTPTPAPTATPHPHPVNETYDSYAEGTLFTKTGTAYYITEGNAQGMVAAKTEVDSNAAPTDMVMAFSAEAKDTTYRIALNKEMVYPLGDAAYGSRYVVLEMDVAIAGTAVKANGYNILFSQLYPGGYLAVVKFTLTDTDIGIHTNSSTVDAKTKQPYTKGEFVKLKVIVDKQSKKVNYYLNDHVVVSERTALFGDIPNLGTICINVPKEATALDSKFYIDNVNLYEIDELPVAPTVAPATPAPTATPVPTVDPNAPTPEPTAEPTATPQPAPTAEPGVPTFVLNENYDSYAVDTLFTSVNNGEYTPSGLKKGKIVAKTVVSSDAGADDKCMEFSASTAAGNYYIAVNQENTFTLGAPVDGQRYVIAEMDVAFGGTETFETGYSILLGQYYPGGNLAVGKFKIAGSYMARHVSTNGIVAATYHKPIVSGQFNNLKIVVDRETKQYTYYWNGDVVETNLRALFTDVPNIGVIRVITPVDEGVEAKLYLDNLKLYSVDSL